MSDRFSGIVRLYGQSAFTRFQQATVMVVGIGGVGSWAAESLARAGTGHLILVDPDDVCLTNTNRQLHAHDPNYGKPKVRVLAERFRLIDPDLRITEHAAFFSEKSSASLLAEPPDAVIDAIDSVRAKCHLIATCHQRGIPLVSSGGAGGLRDPTRIRVADLARTAHDSLLATVRKRLRAEHGFPNAPQKGKAPKFGIEAVFSEESQVFPTDEGETTCERPADLKPGLRCDAGYGTATHVTAAFGLAAAGRILEILRR